MRSLASASLLLAIAVVGCARSGGGSSGLASISPSTSSTSTSASTNATGSPTNRGVAVSGVSSGSSTTPGGVLLAGAARVDVTPPLGVPLAGFGGGERRHKFPNLNPLDYDHFLMPSTGIRDPIYARALFVSDGRERVAIVAIDAIATTDEAVAAAWNRARLLGSSVPFENLMVFASHSHSGPGTLSRLWFWQLTAADLFQQSVLDGFTDGLARAIVAAERSAAPAEIGVGSGQLKGVSHNRRTDDSPRLKRDSIDPEVLVVRVDRAGTGAPIATLWNFGIHGTSLGMDSHVFSNDIMGGANTELESRLPGVSMFANSAEGDIAPDDKGDAGIKKGGRTIADEVVSVRARTTTSSSLEVKSASEYVDFGTATLDVSVSRMGKSGNAGIVNQGWYQVFQKLGIGIGATLAIPQGWVETRFRYQAMRLGKWGLASIPGEAIHEIGLDLKARGKALGFEHVLTCGLANGHMAYITTEVEYGIGGYEALATFWGPKTGPKLVDSCVRQMARVKP